MQGHIKSLLGAKHVFVGVCIIQSSCYKTYCKLLRLLCYSYYSYFFVKIPDESNFRRDGFILAHSLKESLVRLVGYTEEGEHTAAGHIVSTFGKQREMDAGAKVPFSLFTPEPQPTQCYYPHLE